MFEILLVLHPSNPLHLAVLFPLLPRSSNTITTIRSGAGVANTQLTCWYLNLIAVDVKHRLSPDLKIWASPYAVYNWTLHNRTDSQERGRLLNATAYGQFWANVWAAAPAFDFIAPQDSVGWMGNTLSEVKASLTALRSVALSATPARELWSNVEVFEGWPAPCNFPVKCGRHPAPIGRVVNQADRRGEQDCDDADFLELVHAEPEWLRYQR